MDKQQIYLNYEWVKKNLLNIGYCFVSQEVSLSWLASYTSWGHRHIKDQLD